MVKVKTSAINDYNAAIVMQNGRVGTVRYYTKNGLTYVRAASNSHSTNNRTNVQMTQRLTFASLAALYSTLGKHMRGAFPNKAKNQSDYNAFIKANQGEGVYMTKQERAMGYSVALPVIVASEALLRVCPVEEGQSLRIVGQLRSFNNKSGQGNRLVITVFAQSIEPGDGSYFNRILLSGALCKKPVLRRTPLGRSICDVILAVNRHYGRADYLPCIAWGQTAVQIAGMDVGERLALEGRVQSRTYTKLLESGSEERTAFEVSIMQLLDEEETEETALL